MKTLNLSDKQEVHYAVPIWLRDEQIKLAVARVKDRIAPNNEPRNEPVAVVGFGPSLKETWEKIREFKYVMTCSGSHRFLLERGIVPTWHVEVDPRDHKVGLLGAPHKDTEYLIASTCHPKVFEHLSGFNVKLWHIFDSTEDGLRLLPRGEWLITGGCDAGLRAMTLAAFLGFRDLHVFGIDGSAPSETAHRHAAEHPNGKPKYALVNFDGRDFYTTPSMLEAARQTPHEFDQMPAVRAKFYGDGLTQAIMAKHVWKDPKSNDANGKPFANIVGFSKPELISAEYRDLNARLHVDNLAYGVGGGRHAPTVLKLVKSLKKQGLEFVSVLDYGCGKSLLAKALPFPIAEYDPAMPGKQESPRPANLVCCLDVLEHVEPDKLLFVLDDLRRCVLNLGFFVIHTGPSTKLLADGRNSHLIQEGKDWWAMKLRKFFTVAKDSIKEMPPLLYVVVGRKEQSHGTSARTHNAAVGDRLPDFDYQI